MPTPRSRIPNPVAPIVVLAVIVVILTAVAGLTRSWTPKLGLDLRGGTTLTLQARALTKGQAVDPTSLDQAVDIIRRRVDNTGVAEPVVTRQGSDQITVSVPGYGQQQLRKLVGTTAELGFRQVLGYAPVTVTPTFALTDTPSVALPFAPSTAPSPADTPSLALPFAPQATASARPSAASQPSAAAGPATPGSTLTATKAASPSGQPSSSASPSPTRASVAAVIASSISPAVPGSEVAAFGAFSCATLREPVASTPTGYLLTCNSEKNAKFLLGPAFIVGTDVSSASAGLATTNNGAAAGGWEINLTLKDGAPTQTLSQATGKLVALPQMDTTKVGQGTSNFAIVLDGVVVSSPYIQALIPDGRAQISGSFTATTAKDLANVLKYGALPLTLDVLQANTTSATLGAQALRWGLRAGAIGLLLVVLYSFLYYRGLALVVMSSLLIAAVLTYLLVVLLGRQLGYTLSLAGIAGLIVAVGITADSFVVFFERLRDEVREGRSLRTAVETGWVRARRTIIAADFVSFLAAAVLYVLAIGDVRGFAFTLGLTTLIDIVVVFLFTKPLMSLLARTTFFGRGHRLSGLDPGHLGRRGAVGALAGAGPAVGVVDAARARARARTARPGAGPTPEV